MKRRGWLLVVTLFLAFSCDRSSHPPSKTAESGKVENVVCSDGTLLAKGNGITITLADYRYVEKLLNPKAKKFFSNHPEDLLNRIVNRRLVIRFIEEKGLDEKYHVSKEMERFKKEYLARLYVSQEAGKMVGNITEEEIEKRFKELFPKKKLSEMTEGYRKFIANELKVKKYDQAVSSIYGKVEKKISFKKNGDYLVAKCCGIEVKEKISKGEKVEGLRGKLKRRLVTEYFYRKAVDLGLDRDPNFRRMVEEYYASKAIGIFRKVLRSEIIVKDEELKDYYSKNRERFAMPDRARAVVFYFTDEKRAKEAKTLLEKGKDWKVLARRFGEFSAKPKVYYNDPKDPIGTLIFLSGDRKNGKVLMADLGSNRFVVVKVLEYKEGGILPYSKVKDYVRQVLLNKKLREREEEVLEELKRKYKVEFLNRNFVCFEQVQTGKTRL